MGDTLYAYTTCRRYTIEFFHLHDNHKIFHIYEQPAVIVASLCVLGYALLG